MTSAEILAPTAPAGDWNDLSMIDYNIRAERMGWLPSAPQLKTNPLEVAKAAKAAGKDVVGLCRRRIELLAGCRCLAKIRTRRKTGRATCSSGARTCWGLRARGMNISSNTFWAPITAFMGKDLGEEGRQKPIEAVWHDKAPEGKLDLLVTIDFRMSTTCCLFRYRAADGKLV
ncbi:MAG: hypothetical protein V9G14_13000 [Cypionkella sp.]